jgi:hypothetical protein
VVYRLPSPDQFHVALGLVLAVEADRLFDLRELSLDPCVLDVAVGVQFCESLQAQLSAAMVDEPTGALGEEKDKCGENNSWEDLNAQRD